MANTGNVGHGPSGTSRLGQTGGTLGTIQEKAGELASSVAEQAQQAWDTTRQAASSVAETAGDAWDEVAGFMRRYPLATFLAGAAVGFLLATAWSNMPSGSWMIRGMERSGPNPYEPTGT
jgi:ElaB/YqjD/DUF883 family membrane-anchored ribosome-binding protein